MVVLDMELPVNCLGCPLRGAEICKDIVGAIVPLAVPANCPITFKVIDEEKLRSSSFVKELIAPNIGTSN